MHVHYMYSRLEHSHTTLTHLIWRKRKNVSTPEKLSIFHELIFEMLWDKRNMLWESIGGEMEAQSKCEWLIPLTHCMWELHMGLAVSQSVSQLDSVLKRIVYSVQNGIFAAMAALSYLPFIHTHTHAQTFAYSAVASSASIHSPPSVRVLGCIAVFVIPAVVVVVIIIIITIIIIIIIITVAVCYCRRCSRHYIFVVAHIHGASFRVHLHDFLITQFITSKRK